MNRRAVVSLLFSLTLLAAGCGPKEQPKRYPMHGQVKSLDAGTKSANIDAGKIGDWMEAMTMEYPIKPDSEFHKIRPGDTIDATVVVTGGSYYGHRHQSREVTGRACFSLPVSLF